MIEPHLLELLKCPVGKADLEEKGNFLICTSCNIKLPIKERIPVLLLEEAILPEGINSIADLTCNKNKK